MTTRILTTNSDNILDNTNNIIYALDADDYVQSTLNSFVILYGGSGNDLLSLSDGNNIGSQSGNLYGDDGNDYLVGSALSDLMFCGSGNDVVIGGKPVSYFPGGGAEFADDTGVASGNDVIYGETGADALYGLDGDDTIYGGGNADSGTVTWSYSFGSSLSVKGGLFGGAGNDVLYGGDGDDFLDGGTENDLLQGDDDNDTLTGGAGNDTLVGGNGVDLLIGDAGDDILWDGDGADNVFGGDNNDVLYSGLGNDTLQGGAGNDTIWAGYGADYVVGDAGDDVMAAGSNGSLQAFGGTGNDTFQGANGADYAQGDDNNDFLWGYGGADVLVGGANNDTIVGGSGADFMLTGTGTNAAYWFAADIVAGEFDQWGDFNTGTGNLIFLPSFLNGYLSVTDTAIGALISTQIGGSSWGVYFSGATAGQVQSQIIFF